MSEIEDAGDVTIYAASVSFPLSVALRAQFDVANERERQRDEFPPELDDALTPAEWIARITKHLGRAVTMTPEDYRQELVIVGALAVAGIEAFDRKDEAVVRELIA